MNVVLTQYLPEARDGGTQALKWWGPATQGSKNRPKDLAW